MKNSSKVRVNVNEITASTDLTNNDLSNQKFSNLKNVDKVMVYQLSTTWELQVLLITIIKSLISLSLKLSKSTDKTFNKMILTTYWLFQATE